MQSSDIPNEPVDYSPERRDFYRIEDRIGLEIRSWPLAPHWTGMPSMATTLKA